MRLVGMLLAAGASRRMGRLKPLLPFGERTVLEQGIENFRAAAIRPIVLVLGHEAETIRDRLGAALDAEDLVIAFNERHAEGMLTSIQCGVRAADSLAADGILLALVDQPFIPSSVFVAVRDAFLAEPDRIVIPCFGERRGHPIALPMTFRDAILALGGEGVGLRDLIRAHPDRTRLLSVETEAVLRDMDLPDEYERELRAWLAKRS